MATKKRTISARRILVCGHGVRKGLIGLDLYTETMLEVSDDVLKERERQNEKWGRQRHEYPFWLTILVEEVGEVAQAMQQGSVASKDSDADDLYKELIHVAAVASAIAEQVKEEEFSEKNIQ